MADKVRVNLTVNPETKAEWDNAAEQSTEYSSLSDLIRKSVAHELSDTPTVAPRTAEGHETQQAEAVPEAFEDVPDTLENIESALTAFDERLTEIEKEVTTTKRVELKNNIIDALPEIDSQEGPTGKSAEEVAEEINESPHRVEEVLSQMGNEMGIVERVENVEGQNFYAHIGNN
ncbi:hypothetical protein [Halolamina sp. C58]|uniref:hypothetical protein n=1 Tax=Halolamina sp. C58 TaxID=3421640 RepID=UPI003EBAD9FA